MLVLMNTNSEETHVDVSLERIKERCGEIFITDKEKSLYIDTVVSNMYLRRMAQDELGYSKDTKKYIVLVADKYGDNEVWASELSLGDVLLAAYNRSGFSISEKKFLKDVSDLETTGVLVKHDAMYKIFSTDEYDFEVDADLYGNEFLVIGRDIYIKKGMVYTVNVKGDKDDPCAVPTGAFSSLYKLCEYISDESGLDKGKVLNDMLKFIKGGMTKVFNKGGKSYIVTSYVVSNRA